MTAPVAPSPGPSRSGGACARPASILAAETVSRRFRARGGARRGDAGEVRAVEAVSLEVRTGETLGLVGESGSGKSTLGRLLVGLETPDEGRVLFDGAPIAGLRRAGALRFRRAVQVVFQDPYASLNPRLKVGPMLREILQVHGIARGPEAGERVERLLERVGLDADAARRHPHEFSGGQRQRVGIARALVVDPRIIIADEPVSALDVSVQAKILGLLGELQRDLGLGYLFISHDLAVVRGIAHRVAVMREGRIVESGPADRVFADPGHEYTRSLLAAVPRLPRPA